MAVQIPMRKRILCSTRDILERLIVKINYNIRNVSQGVQLTMNTSFADFDTAELDMFQ